MECQPFFYHLILTVQSSPFQSGLTFSVSCKQPKIYEWTSVRGSDVYLIGRQNKICPINIFGIANKLKIQSNYFIGILVLHQRDLYWFRQVSVDVVSGSDLALAGMSNLFIKKPKIWIQTNRSIVQKFEHEFRISQWYANCVNYLRNGTINLFKDSQSQQLTI